jgi:hypothetical protein
MALTLRPTFELTSVLTVAELADRLTKAFTDAGLEAHWSRVAGASLQRREDESFVMVHFPESQREKWSPWLQLELKRAAQGGTELFGRFTPHPNVWSAYTLGYLGLSVASFFAAMFCIAQYLAGSSVTAWWIIAACLIVGAGMWWASQVGQRLARGQMEHLRRLVDASV